MKDPFGGGGYSLRIIQEHPIFWEVQCSNSGSLSIIVIQFSWQRIPYSLRLTRNVRKTGDRKMYSFNLHHCSIYFCCFDWVQNIQHRVIILRKITKRKKKSRWILLLPKDLSGFSALTSSKMSKMSVVSPSRDCSKSNRHWADTPLLDPVLAASCIKKGNFSLFNSTSVWIWFDQESKFHKHNCW